MEKRVPLDFLLVCQVKNVASSKKFSFRARDFLAPYDGEVTGLSAAIGDIRRQVDHAAEADV